MCLRANIFLLASPAFSNSFFFAEAFISFSRFFITSFFFPPKNSRMFQIVFLYSFLPISPEHTPGQRPIWRLKHGFPEAGRHLSLKGKIFLIIFRASFKAPPLGKGPK